MSAQSLPASFSLALFFPAVLSRELFSLPREVWGWLMVSQAEEYAVT